MTIRISLPGRIHPLLAALLLALAPPAVPAAQPVRPPNAGTILQQVQPEALPAPAPTGTGLEVEKKTGDGLSSSAPFQIKTLQITGNTLFDTATLQALVADAEGQILFLSQLGAVADRITEYYRSHGYPLTRALIPAQTIRDGVVRIEILEAHYGKIKLDNRSRVDTGLLQDTLDKLQSEEPILQLKLDRTLLLISDIPGIAPKATLSPGAAFGTSDLLLEVEPGPVAKGNVTLDNYGDYYTGRPRLGFTLNLINPLGFGDVLSVSGMTSGSGMNYGQLSYELLLNGDGTRIGASYSALNYGLGESLSSLEAHGDARVAGVWARHPLIRSRAVNLFGQIQYDHVQLSDRIDVASINSDRHLNNWTASLSGDWRDSLLSGAVNAWNLGWTAGQLNFDDSQAQSIDSATANIEGRFSKWTANLVRLQRLSPQNALFIRFAGQWADKNLDSSQKMVAGGPYTVRAYDMGALSGDTGYLVTAEFRRNLGSWYGQWQALTFVDTQHVRINKNPWVAARDNSATLSGVGAGLNWSGPEQWSGRAYVATPIGSTPALIGSTDSVRAWAEVSKAF